MSWDEKDGERETDRQIERERRKREPCHKWVIERQNEMSVVNDILSDSNIDLRIYSAPEQHKSWNQSFI